MASYSFEIADPQLTLVEKSLIGMVTLPQSVDSSRISIGGTFAVATGNLNMTADPVGSGGSGGSSIIQRTIPALARVSP